MYNTSRFLHRKGQSCSDFHDSTQIFIRNIKFDNKINHLIGFHVFCNRIIIFWSNMLQFWWKMLRKNAWKLMQNVHIFMKKSQKKRDLRIFCIIPSALIKYEILKIPSYSLPYIFFIPIASYFLITLLSESETNGNGNFCFSQKFFCDLTESALIPRITVFLSLKLWNSSRSSWPSVVHPGVLAFG